MKNAYKLKQWHQFEIRGKYFVFITDNLRLYNVEKDVFERLKELQTKYGYQNTFEWEDSDRSLLDELSAEEMIVCADSETHDSKLNEKEISEEIQKNSSTPIVMHSLLLQLSNDCNLNCLYCYGDGGSYGRKRELMDFDIAKKGIDLMMKNRGDQKELLIIFFGGEPLLNFKVIQQIDQYCKELEKVYEIKFRYSMTTNGTILTDEIYNFIKENNVIVMISMDGGKDIQDCYRCYENGLGSYDTVVKNIERFKSARNGYLSARATVCKPNLNMRKIKDDLTSLGFTAVNLSIVDTRQDSPLFVGNENKEAVRNSYLELAEDYIEGVKSNRPIQSNLFLESLKDLYYKKLKMQSCRAGRSGFALGTDGNIYPCQRFMGMEDYIVGNIAHGIDISLANKYLKSNVFFKEDCKNCWVKYLCGGACPHTCVTQENDIMKAPKCYCELYKSTFEVILYIYYSIKDWNKDYFKDIFENERSKSAS